MPLVTDPEKADVLILVDGHNLIMRSWLVKNFTKGFKNEHDYPTCHIYNSMMKLRMWANHFGLKAGKRVCFIFSIYENRGVRQALYPAYKAQREKADYESYDVQDAFGRLCTKTCNPITDCDEVFRCLPGVHLTPVNNDGETDDILSTAIRLYRKIPGIVIYQMTGDHDAWGDMNDNVHIGTGPKELFTIEHLKRPWKPTGESGFSTANPRKIALAKALFGDSSDNIHKVKRATEDTVGWMLRACKRDPERDGQYYAPGFLRLLKKTLRENPNDPAKCCLGFEQEIIDKERMIRLRNRLELNIETVKANPAKLEKLLKWYGIKKDLPSFVSFCRA